MAEVYAPSTSKGGICVCDRCETYIYPAVCIDGNWTLVDSYGVISYYSSGWNDFRFTEITREAITEIVKAKWPREDSILEVSDRFEGRMIDFSIYKIDYSAGKVNGRAVHESGESFYDSVRKSRRRDFWTPEEATAFLCELCEEKLESVFGHIATHEADIARAKENGELLKERFRNYKPKLTLKERVDEKLNGMTTEEIAKAIGV